MIWGDQGELLLPRRRSEKAVNLVKDNRPENIEPVELPDNPR
jgi:hypothetical protein